MKRLVLTLSMTLSLGYGSLATAQEIYLQPHNALQHQAQQPVSEDEEPTITLVNYFDKGCCGAVEPCDQGCYGCPTACCNGEKPWSATIALNQDVFFGFYPTLAASYAISDRLDFTFYSILWTTADFSFTNGQGLWTEVGLGLNANFMDGALNVNPQIGILNGSLLSGAGAPPTPRAAAFEGVVPNVTINYDDGLFESEFYMGYYIGTRGPASNDFLHWWYNAGVRPLAGSGGVGEIFSTGVHFEHLRLTSSNLAGPGNVYMWLGPYVNFTLPNDVGLWFGAGWDVSSGQNSDFYKASISYSF